jgi:osmoprotectant transport system ATP-binding protein
LARPHRWLVSYEQQLFANFKWAKFFMLELQGVSKSYGDFTALHPTDLKIASGTTTALLGQSGCGKSTIMRIIVGIVQPTTGTVWFDGEQLSEKTIKPMRQRMGYMIQEGGLFPHLTLAQNVTLMARYLGWDGGKVQDRLHELGAMVQLPTDSLNRYPMQVSGGQRQRVALMRALFLDPDVLLLDEPMGALDPLIRSELQDQLRQIFATLKKTVILVTHDIGEAGFLAEDIVLLKSGRVVQTGTLESMVKSPAEKYVEEFVNAQRSPLESIG